MKIYETILFLWGGCSSVDVCSFFLDASDVCACFCFCTLDVSDARLFMFFVEMFLTLTFA